MTAPSRLLVVSPVVTHPATQGNSARIQALGQQLLSRSIAAELLYYGMEGLTAWQEAGMSAFWSRFHFVKSTPLPPPSLGSSWGVDSTLLCESICSERPDVVLLKSMDYDLSEFLIRRLDLSHTKIGFIVGGINVHPVLQHADFVLTESQRQSREVREFLNRPVPVEPLSKYVNWELADQLYANSTDPKRFDIVNVGFFDEGKNQIQLKPFFGKYRIAIVGHGPMLASVQQAAEGYSDVTFFGDVANDEALRIISQSRLMVHTSLWEGVPRTIIEALTCGTPVVAFDFAIQGDFGQTRAVRLVSREGLEPTVEELLDDLPGLGELSKEARRFALETHGAQKLEEAARQILLFADQTRRTDAPQRIAV